MSVRRDTAGVDLTADMSAPCLPEELFAWVDDLSRYPSWLGIIERAETTTSPTTEPAWMVDLRGRVGPFARSKRLRMVRTRLEVPLRAVFERRETDGRHHSHWRLGASVDPIPSGSQLSMHLHYGGSLWAPVIERMLAEEIDRGRERLLELVSAPKR